MPMRARPLRDRRGRAWPHSHRRKDAARLPPPRRQGDPRALRLLDRSGGGRRRSCSAPEENEITAALVLLKGLPLDGAIITGDTIFTQREIRQHIRDRNGHYLFVVKDNQPALRAGIAEAFGDHSPLGPEPHRQRAAA